MANEKEHDEDRERIEGRLQSAFCQTLARILPTLKQRKRVAQVLSISEQTVRRWTMGESFPHTSIIKRIPQAITNTQERQDVIESINHTFPGVLDVTEVEDDKDYAELTKTMIQEVSREGNPDKRTERAWEIIQDTIFNFLDNEIPHIIIVYAELRSFPQSKVGTKAALIQQMRELLKTKNENIEAELLRLEEEAQKESQQIRMAHSLLEIYSTIDEDVNPLGSFLGSESLAGRVVSTHKACSWDRDQDTRIIVQIVGPEQSAFAFPILRGDKVAGSLIISSTKKMAFEKTLIQSKLQELAVLFALAVPEEKFYSPRELGLIPMPDYTIQRPYITDKYQRYVIEYAQVHHAPRKERILYAQHRLALELANIVRQEQDEEPIYIDLKI